MLTGQLNWTDLSDLASQLVGRGNVAPVDDSEAAFALLYTEVLGLVGEQSPGIRATIDNGLLATDDYGGPTRIQTHPGRDRRKRRRNVAESAPRLQPSHRFRIGRARTPV